MITGMPDTVAYDKNTNELVAIDQTLLPGELRLLRLSDAEAISDAIKRLAIRGAPAIGVAAAVGLAVCASRMPEDGSFFEKLYTAAQTIRTSRPTAVNLEWAVSRTLGALKDGCSAEEAKHALLDEALKILAEDIENCRRIGENGLSLIDDGARLLTHCNAGQLATVRWGTALAPVHVGLSKGMRFTVYCDETRPLLQGMRLSAYEMAKAGADVTVICDNMAAGLMRDKKIDAVFVGSDRIAANGDAANKIGTLGVAVLAKHFGVPFYVCAPYSTVDKNTATGEQIIIEQRDEKEVTELWFGRGLAPAEAKVYNPAFDVTSAELITAWITEKGVFRDASML